MIINFNYEGINITYQLNDMKEKINDVFHKCRNDIDLNSILFLYNGSQVNGNISVDKIINNNDIKRNMMNILILNRNEES